MIAIFLISFFVSIDQITKRIAYAYLQNLGSIPITNFLSLTYLENRGAAFGIFYGARWFFIIFTIIILVGILFYYRSLPKSKHYTLVRISLILISSGAIGNFIDRFLFGFVIDFFHITAFNFPIFNIADILIVTGAIIFAIMTLIIKE